VATGVWPEGTEIVAGGGRVVAGIIVETRGSTDTCGRLASSVAIGERVDEKVKTVVARTSSDLTNDPEPLTCPDFV
jgi:hypothetical protein